MSYILYDGPTQLTTSTPIPILCLITGIYPKLSSNIKTGPQAQAYVFNRDVSPTIARQTNVDHAVCGDCKLRTANSGGCYVLRFKAPNIVYRQWSAGKYKPTTPEDLAQQLLHHNQSIRWGADGDPSALPQELIEGVMTYQSHRHPHRRVKGTAYTHQWRDPRFQWLKRWAMASCDSLSERNEAKKLGWRVFLVVPPHVEVAGTMKCPADALRKKEGLKTLTCAECLACGGWEGGDERFKLDVTIRAHGGAIQFKKMLRMLEVIWDK